MADNAPDWTPIPCCFTARPEAKRRSPGTSARGISRAHRVTGQAGRYIPRDGRGRETRARLSPQRAGAAGLGLGLSSVCSSRVRGDQGAAGHQCCQARPLLPQRDTGCVSPSSGHTGGSDLRAEAGVCLQPTNLNIRRTHSHHDSRLPNALSSTCPPLSLCEEGADGFVNSLVPHCGQAVVTHGPCWSTSCWEAGD